MNWLNNNAGAIQALTTVVLVGVTYWYVRLTREIAEANSEQVKQTIETDRLDRQQYAQTLEFFALRLREAIGDLSDEPIHQKLRESFFLTESDITELRVLARKVNRKAINAASQAAMSLRVMHGIIQKAKSINEGTGWSPADQEKEIWRKARAASEVALHALQEECEKAAGN